MTEHAGNERSVASRFTRSVNIQQDIWQAESLQGYLVTAGARRALLRIAPALHTPKAARAWTLTGPYGTGKSALANFIAKLLGRRPRSGPRRGLQASPCQRYRPR